MREYMYTMSRKFYCPAFGLFLIRLAIGLVFLVHGWHKVSNMASTEQFFGTLGLPAWVAVCIAWLEVIGGLMLIFGILTRSVAKLFGIEMLVSIFLTGIGRGWGAHEYEVVLMLASFGLTLAGSGKISMYSMECSRCHGMFCKGGCEEDKEM